MRKQDGNDFRNVLLVGIYDALGRTSKHIVVERSGTVGSLQILDFIILSSA